MEHPSIMTTDTTPTFLDDSNAPLVQQWQADCDVLGIAVTQAQLETLDAFYRVLIETNRHTNLTRITNEEGFLYRHVLDSLILSPFIGEGDNVIDIGSGAGFPAIPLAIFRPDITVTAVDSVGKKCRFIETVAETLTLSNLKVESARAEELAHKPKHREQYDIALARAVASLPLLLEFVSGFIKPSGMFIASKGEKAAYELAISKKAMDTLSLDLEDHLEAPATHPETEQLVHPLMEGGQLLIFSKIEPLDSLYPRNAGVIKKNPL